MSYSTDRLRWQTFADYFGLPKHDDMDPFNTLFIACKPSHNDSGKTDPTPNKKNHIRVNPSISRATYELMMRALDKIRVDRPMTERAFIEAAIEKAARSALKGKQS